MVERVRRGQAAVYGNRLSVDVARLIGGEEQSRIGNFDRGSTALHRVQVADLVLLEGDPLEDIWAISRIAGVFANGRYFDRAALDQLLIESSREWPRVRELERRATKRGK